jgi:hypothetical protein
MARFVVTFALCLQYTSSDGTYVRPATLIRQYTCHWTWYTRKRLRIKHAVVYKQLLALSGFTIRGLVAGQRPQMHILEEGFLPNGEASRQKLHLYLLQPIPVAARSSAWDCGRYLPGIAGSNPDGNMAVGFLSVLFVVK